MRVKLVIKLFTFLFCLAFFLSFSTKDANAATKYWIGSNGGLFSDDVNWSTSSGGANNTTAPGASDIATFDSGVQTMLVSHQQSQLLVLISNQHIVEPCHRQLVQM